MKEGGKREREKKGGFMDEGRVGEGRWVMLKKEGEVAEVGSEHEGVTGNGGDNGKGGVGKW